jgi:hypothetical protein
MQTTAITHRDQDYIYSKRAGQLYKTCKSTKTQESISTIPSHVVPYVYSFNTLFPATFQQSKSSSSEIQDIQQIINYSLPDHIIIFTDASVQNQISSIAWWWQIKKEIFYINTNNAWQNIVSPHLELRQLQSAQLSVH